MKIPKIIHMIWFGKKEMSEEIKKYVATWKEKCPDYEVMLWNEENFDINTCQFAREAYENKKYAFVSDYARLKVLYEYGGIYLDTDVGLEKSLDEFLNVADGVLSFENDVWLGTAVMFASKHAKWLEPLIEYYEKIPFIKKNGKFNQTANCALITGYLNNYYDLKIKESKQILRGGEILILPREYFAPLYYLTGEINKTENTYAIHYHNFSWADKKLKLGNKISKNLRKFFGKSLFNHMENITMKRWIKREGKNIVKVLKIKPTKR